LYKKHERDICSLYLAGEARELLDLAESGEGFMGDLWLLHCLN